TLANLDQNASQELVEVCGCDTRRVDQHRPVPILPRAIERQASKGGLSVAWRAKDPSAAVRVTDDAGKLLQLGLASHEEREVGHPCSNTEELHYPFAPQRRHHSDLRIRCSPSNPMTRRKLPR